MPTRITVVYYSATGDVFMLREHDRGGRRAKGRRCALRKVRELAAGRGHRRRIPDGSPIARRRPTSPRRALDDLEWADGFAFGSPTRFGLPAAPLKLFLDQTGALWMRKQLVDKVGTTFTSSSTSHGGLEATILAINTVLYHWGSIVMPLGYTDATVDETGNPYGASWVSRKRSVPDDAALATSALAGEATRSCRRGGRGTRNAANSHSRLIVNPSFS